MFRNKYKYCKNHGLLPVTPARPKRSHPITSIAIINLQHPNRQYQIHSSPTNEQAVLLYNDRQFLQRECSWILESNTQLPQQLSNTLPKHKQSLTIYVANNHDQCTSNIHGNKNQKSGNGLLNHLYSDLSQKKQNNSVITLSVLGIQNENDLTDLLTVDYRDQTDNHLPQHLRNVSYLRRRVKVSRQGQGWAEDLHKEEIDSEKNLQTVLQRYKDIKNQLQYTAFMRPPRWDWLQGQLFILSELQYDEQYHTVRRCIRTHYLLRVNQYLRSAAPMMLKLGMSIRSKQQGRKVCDNNQSKIFRVLGRCFGSESFHINLILQIGYYGTLKEEYQYLVPTSEIISDKTNQTIQTASFLYIRHYPDHPSIVTLLAKISQTKKEVSDCQVQPPQLVQIQSIKKNRTKSYVYDTISSIQKKNIRNPLVIEQYAFQETNFVDIEEFIRKTAKQYKKQDYLQQDKNQSFYKGFKTSFKESQKQKKNRLSLIEWSRPKQVLTPKIYKSRNQIQKQRIVDRSAGEPLIFEITQKQKSKFRNSAQLETIYGTHVRRSRQNRSVRSTKIKKDTNQMVDQIVRRQIIELGREDQFLQEQEPSDDGILQ